MKTDNKSLEDNRPADALSADESRRRFVKGSLAVAPVLMTVTSRPVWGHVCAPSGMASGNVSDATAGTEGECVVGYGPDEYASGAAPWPASVSDGAYFDEIFGVGPHSKFKQVIGQPQNFDEFERAAAAALLNAAAGLMPYLGSDLGAVSTIITMVHDVYGGGQYCPAPGVFWDKQQVLDYFILTFYGPWG